MFTVSKTPQGEYKISTGDGSPVHARSVAELQLAVAHYFETAHGAKDVAACPFCEWIADRRVRNSIRREKG